MIGRALSPEERWALVEYLKVLGSPEFERRLVPAQTPPWTPGPKCSAGATDRATLNLGNGEARGMAPPPSPPSAPLPSGDA